MFVLPSMHHGFHSGWWTSLLRSLHRAQSEPVPTGGEQHPGEEAQSMTHRVSRSQAANHWKCGSRLSTQFSRLPTQEIRVTDFPTLWLPPPTETVTGPSYRRTVEFGPGDARNYVAKASWRFAKTMPQWPHEYTVRAWRPDLEESFCAFASLIRTEGVVKPWPRDAAMPRYRHPYLRARRLAVLDDEPGHRGGRRHQPGAP